MKLSKSLQTLIERVERNGKATKRVRKGAVMGAFYGMSREDVKNTPMVEQWRVTITDTEQDGIKYRNIIVDHYGTEIAHIIQDLTQGVNTLYNYYGESNSDRDALNGLCHYYGLSNRFSYRPSLDEFKEVV